MKRIYILTGLLLMAGLLAFGQQSPLSKGIYRLPYVNGTDVSIAQDHLTHSPAPNRLDMRGTNGTGPYQIAAAADGIIRSIEDGNTGSCSIANVTSCSDCNNYVWIEHPNGEWTKYTHFITNSVTVTAGLKVGDEVCAGTFLGFEGDIGATRGSQGRTMVACNGDPVQQALIDQAHADTIAAGGDSLRTFIHLHFEVAVPDDLSNPFDTVGGFINGTNRIPIFCDIPGNIAVQGQTYTADPCDGGVCPDNITLPNFVETGIRVIQADQEVDSDGSIYTVAASGQVHHRAGQRIVLQQGFRATAGSYYNARIAPCNRIAGTPLTSCFSLTEIPSESKTRITSPSSNSGETDGIRLYPNPTNGVLRMEFNGTMDKPVRIELTDLMGRPLRVPSRMEEGAGTMDLSSLPNGVYWLRYWMQERLMTKLVVKQGD